MASGSVQAFVSVGSSCKTILHSAGREDVDATTSRSVSTALEVLRLASDAHRFLGSALCTSAHRRQFAVSTQSLINQVVDVCAGPARAGSHADPTAAALDAMLPARLSDTAPLIIGMLNAAALLSSRLCRQLLAPSPVSAAAPAARKRGGGGAGGLAFIDGGADDASVHSSGSGAFGGVDAAHSRELSAAACRIVTSQLLALTAALRRGHGSVPLLQPALLLSLAAFTALAPSQPLAFRPFAIDAAAAILELLEAQSDHVARAGQAEALCATAGDAAALHAALSDALATAVRLCAYARWPASTLTAGLTGSGAGSSGAGSAGGSSGSAANGSGSSSGASPFALHLSPFVHRLLSLLDGDAALLMSVVSGAPYAAPAPPAVAHMLAAPAPDYASLAASAKTAAGAPTDGAATGAGSGTAAARPDALVAPALFARLLAVMGALTSLVSPPVGGISTLTEDGVASLGLAAPAPLPVGALLASLAGLSSLPSLRRIGLSQAQSEAVLSRALRLQGTVYAAGGPALRRFRTHALGVHAALLRQPLAGGHANPIAAQRLRLLPAWIRAVGPGLPSPDFEAVLRAHVLDAAACLAAFCCGGSSGAVSTGSAGGVAEVAEAAVSSAVSADTACAAAACLHAVIASCWYHLPDGLRLTAERILLACLDAAAGSGAAAARAAAPAAAAALSAAAAAGYGGAGGAAAGHMAADGDAYDDDEEGEGEGEEDEGEDGVKVPGRLSKRGRYFKGSAAKFLSRINMGAGGSDHAAAGVGSSFAAGAPDSAGDAAPAAKRLRRGVGADAGADGEASADSGNAPLAVLESLGGPLQHGLGASVAACLLGSADIIGSGRGGAHGATALLAVRAGRAGAASSGAAGPALVLLPPAVLASLAGAAAACASAPWRAGAPSPLQQLLRQHTGACSGGGAGGARALGLHSLALALPAHAPGVADGAAMSLPALRALAASTAVAEPAALLAAAAAQAEAVPALPPALQGVPFVSAIAIAAAAPAPAAATAPIATAAMESETAVASAPSAPSQTAAAAPLASDAVPESSAAGVPALPASQSSVTAPPPAPAAPAAPANAAASAAGAVDEDEDEFPDIVD